MHESIIQYSSIYEEMEIFDNEFYVYYIILYHKLLVTSIQCVLAEVIKLDTSPCINYGLLT